MSRHAELMKLHDGELDKEHAEELERVLDEEDERVLAGLDQIGDVIRAHADARSGAARDIADLVMERLDEPGVAAGDPEPKAKPALELVASSGTPSARRQRSTLAVLVAGVVLSAAAAIALYFAANPDAPPPPAPVAVTAPAPAPAPSPPPVEERDPAPAEAIEDDATPAVAIEAVDFGNR
jgi:hypothetical protein